MPFECIYGQYMLTDTEKKPLSRVKLTMELIVQAYPEWLETEFEVTKTMSLRFLNGAEGDPTFFFKRIPHKELGGLIQSKNGFRKEDCKSRYPTFTSMIPKPMWFEEYCKGVMDGNIKIGNLPGFQEEVRQHKKKMAKKRKSNDKPKKKKVKKKKIAPKKKQGEDEEMQMEESEESESDSDNSAGSLVPTGTGSKRPPPPPKDSVDTRIKKELVKIKGVLEKKLDRKGEDPFNNTDAGKIIPQLWRIGALKITPKFNELLTVYVPHRKRQLAELANIETTPEKKTRKQGEYTMPKPVSEIFTKWLETLSEFPNPEDDFKPGTNDNDEEDTHIQLEDNPDIIAHMQDADEEDEYVSTVPNPELRFIF